MDKLWLLLLILLISCGQNHIQGTPIESKIFGGKKSDTKDWTNVVSLNTSEKGSFCSGVAIEKDLILTAAHCLTESVKSYHVKKLVSIYYGKGRDSHYRGRYKIREFGVHPNYSSRFASSDFDFAYIILEEPLPISWKSIIDPISDTLSFDTLKVRQEVTIIGYGRRNNNRTGRKSSVETTIWKTSNNEFYAGGGGHDACFGDSGGGIFTTLKNGSVKLIGITSRSAYPTSGCGFGSVFGKIDIALTWLAQAGIYHWHHNDQIVDTN